MKKNPVYFYVLILLFVVALAILWPKTTTKRLFTKVHPARETTQPIPIPLYTPPSREVASFEHYEVNKKTNQVLFFTSNSCRPCAKMKKLVWPDPAVQTAVGEYDESPVTVNSSNPEDEAKFNDYHIKYVPTIIIVDEEGEELKRSTGYMDVNQLVNFLK